MSDRMKISSESLTELARKATWEFCENLEHKTLKPDEAFATHESAREWKIQFREGDGLGEIVVKILDGNVQITGTYKGPGWLGSKIITDPRGHLVFEDDVRTCGTDLDSFAKEEILGKLVRTWRNRLPRNSRRRLGQPKMVAV